MSIWTFLISIDVVVTIVVVFKWLRNKARKRVR